MAARVELRQLVGQLRDLADQVGIREDLAGLVRPARDGSEKIASTQLRGSMHAYRERAREGTNA